MDSRRLAGKGGKSEIPVLKANGNTHISSEDKAKCLSYSFVKINMILIWEGKGGKSRSWEGWKVRNTSPEGQWKYTHLFRRQGKMFIIFFCENLPSLKQTTTKVYQSFTLGLPQAGLRLCSGPAKFKTRNAKARYHVPALVLNMVALELATPLSRLASFNYVLKEGYLPAHWKCVNHRPINLLCIISKVMEKLVSKKMWKNLDQHHLIFPR